MTQLPKQTQKQEEQDGQGQEMTSIVSHLVESCPSGQLSLQHQRVLEVAQQDEEFAQLASLLQQIASRGKAHQMFYEGALLASGPLSDLLAPASKHVTRACVVNQAGFATAKRLSSSEGSFSGRDCFP